MVDSTAIQLVARCIDWTKHRRRKAAAKCHMRLDLQSFLPHFAIVDTAGEHDILHFRKTFPQVRLIAMSGKPTAAMMLSIAHTLGAVAVLEKPFAAQRLLSAVSEALHTTAPIRE